MSRRNLPTIAQLADEVYDFSHYLKDNYDPKDLIEPGTDEPAGDCRLQVMDDEEWSFHTGDSQYDTDHRGQWASSSVGVGISKREAREIARDMLSQIDNDF